MNEQTYNIWSWSTTTFSGSEGTIYYNDFLVYVVLDFTSRECRTRNEWTQLGTINVPSGYRPNAVIYIGTNDPNIKLRIKNNGNLEYYNSGTGVITLSNTNMSIMYPRTSSLP